MHLRVADAPPQRLARALTALEGLSLGDGFGERFFDAPGRAIARILARALPPAPWPTTDDTAMASAIVEILAAHGGIECDALARRFTERFVAEPDRGYGGGAFSLLWELARGQPWPAAAAALFDGQGSMGNGAAMRAAPIGAYFAGDDDAVIDHADRSARVTHTHPEGRAGAIAVALAAGWAALHGPDRGADRLLAHAVAGTPEGPTRHGLALARRLPASTSAAAAAERLGSGDRVLAADTVPFALWCAAHHLGDFEAAMWATVEGLGDRDTTCAIAGGIVALAVGPSRLPAAWLRAREPLALTLPLADR